jgi:hypothetical protein
MRFRSLILFGSGLLAACSQEESPVRLDFVGATRFTSGNRTAGAGDTLTTRLYADADAGAELKRLRITVAHEPSRNPFRYPLPLSSFVLADQPNDAPLVYLDSLISGRSLVFQNTFGVRTTSGTERWEYTVEDQSGNHSTRAFRVTVRNTDSLRIFHTYKAVAGVISPSATNALAQSQARRYLALYPGLLLPGFAVRTQPANQALVDLIFVNSGGVLTLRSPAADTTTQAAQRRATQLRLSSILGTAITGVDTDTEFASVFNLAQPFAGQSVATTALAKDQVLAFRTADRLYGLIHIIDLVPTAQGTVIPCTVRIQKKP